MRPTTGLLFADFMNGSGGAGYSTAEKPSKIERPTSGLLFASFVSGSDGPDSDDAYALISSVIGIAVTGGETDEYGEPTTGFGITKAHY